MSVSKNWKVGDLVWAKYEKWPWWPAVVYDVSASKSVCVIFIDVKQSYAWIRAGNIEQFRSSAECGPSGRRQDSKSQTRLRQAERADKLRSFSREHRLQAVGANLESLMKPLSVRVERLTTQDCDKANEANAKVNSTNSSLDTPSEPGRKTGTVTAASATKPVRVVVRRMLEPGQKHSAKQSSENHHLEATVSEYSGDLANIESQASTTIGRKRKCAKLSKELVEGKTVSLATGSWKGKSAQPPPLLDPDEGSCVWAELNSANGNLDVRRSAESQPKSAKKMGKVATKPVKTARRRQASQSLQNTCPSDDEESSDLTGKNSESSATTSRKKKRVKLPGRKPKQVRGETVDSTSVSFNGSKHAESPRSTTTSWKKKHSKLPSEQSKQTEGHLLSFKSVSYSDDRHTESPRSTITSADNGASSVGGNSHLSGTRKEAEESRNLPAKKSKEMKDDVGGLMTEPHQLSEGPGLDSPSGRGRMRGRGRARRGRPFSRGRARGVARTLPERTSCDDGGARRGRARGRSLGGRLCGILRGRGVRHSISVPRPDQPLLYDSGCEPSDAPDVSYMQQDPYAAGYMYQSASVEAKLDTLELDTVDFCVDSAVTEMLTAVDQCNTVLSHVTAAVSHISEAVVQSRKFQGRVGLGQFQQDVAASSDDLCSAVGDAFNCLLSP